MVVSKLNGEINYEEIKRVQEGDRQHESSIYVINIGDVPIMIVLGGEKYTYIAKNIIYIPIYLVYKGVVKEKIGVFEAMASSLPDLLDEDNDLDVELLGDPLLFSYVSEDYVRKYEYEDDSESASRREKSEEDDDEEEDEGVVKIQDGDDEKQDDSDSDEEDKKEKEDEEEKEPRTGEEKEDKGEDKEDKQEEFESLESIQKEHENDDVLPREHSLIRELFEEDNDDAPLDVEETKEDADHHRREFTRGTNWVQTLFHNKNYTIVDNEAGGDCLFAVIREAFASIGKRVTVKDLRRILANEVTEATFTEYKKLYDSISDNIVTSEKEMNQLVRENNSLKREFNKATSTEQQKVILDRSEKIVNRFERIKGERDSSRYMIDEYKFMEGIHGVDDFKTAVQRCSFWADTWAISTLERVLNVKLILLSKYNYESGDIANVMQCGQLNDEQLQQKGVFKPKYYIITEWRGDHYKNILYKGKTMLTFEQIPFDVKALIKDKCLEMGALSYLIIPKFKALMGRIAEEEVEVLGEKEEAEIEDGAASREGKAGSVRFDDNTVFQFYHKSADSKPGMGSGETIRKEDRVKYATLAAVPHWRRKLTNVHPSEFTLNGEKWYTVEHYVQAMKYKATSPDVYKMFTMGGGSGLAKDVDAIRALQMGKKSFGGKRILPKEVKEDPEYSTHVEKYVRDAQEAKFKQNKEANTILRDTKDAKLMFFQRKRPAVVMYSLMKIREKL